MNAGEELRLKHLTGISKMLVEVLSGDLSQSEKDVLDLGETPGRVAKMWMEMIQGHSPDYQEEVENRLTLFKSNGSHEMVVQGPISFQSLCAHHMLPFVGSVWVGYVPAEKVAGLSKFTRVVRMFALRLQMQEFLTTQIADYLQKWLAPAGLVVVVEAKHMCMEVRGVREPNVFTTTSALRGIGVKPGVKEEFYRLMRRT